MLVAPDELLITVLCVCIAMLRRLQDALHGAQGTVLLDRRIITNNDR